MRRRRRKIIRNIQWQWTRCAHRFEIKSKFTSNKIEKKEDAADAATLTTINTEKKTMRRHGEKKKKDCTRAYFLKNDMNLLPFLSWQTKTDIAAFSAPAPPPSAERESEAEQLCENVLFQFLSIRRANRPTIDYSRHNSFHSFVDVVVIVVVGAIVDLCTQTTQRSAFVSHILFYFSFIIIINDLLHLLWFLR